MNRNPVENSACDPMRELLSALLDEELTAEESNLLESHLAGCQSCRRELDELREAVSTARSWVLPRGGAVAEV